MEIGWLVRSEVEFKYPRRQLMMREELQEWLRFLRAESNVLRLGSSRLFQMAMNQPDSSAIARAGRARFEAGRELRPWFDWVNKSQRVSPESLTLTGHAGQVLRCAYAADKRQLVSLSQQVRHYNDKSDNNQPTELIWWNVLTGAIISTHLLDVELITGSAFSDDARLLALAVNPFRQLSKDQRLSDPAVSRSIKLIDTESGSLVAVLPGCDQQIHSCSFSRDGTRLVTGDWAGTVKVWDVHTHQALLTIPAHAKAVGVCAFSPNGSLIVTADSVDLRFWDTNTGDNLRTLDRRAVVACAFVSDQKLAITTNELSIIDVNTGEVLLSEAAGGSLLTILGISPDLPVMVTGRGGMVLRTWQADALADTGKLRGHEDAITSVAFLEQGSRQIASTANDGTIRIWDLPRTSEVATFDKHKGFVRRMAFLGDANRLVSGGDDEFVRIWERDSAKELLTIPVGAHGAGALACSSDGRHVAIGTWWYEQGSEQGFMAVWRIEGATASKVAEVNAGCVYCAYASDGKFLAAINDWTHMVSIYTGRELQEVTKLSAEGWKPKACTFSPDGELLIVAGDDLVNRLELRLFHTSGWREVAKLKTGQWRATDCAISPDGRLVAAASKSSGLATIELKTGKVTLVGNAANPTSCSFSPDGRYLVCGTEAKTLEVWDLSENKTWGILAGHSASISDCEWSPDGKSIASCSHDGSAKLWDPVMVAESSDEPEMRGSVSACRYSPDNKFVLTMGQADSSLKLWNTANGGLVSQLPGRVVQRRFAYAYSVGYVIAGDDDGELKLFTAEGNVLRKLEGDRNPINSLAVSPGGERLAVAAGRLRDLKVYEAHTLSQMSAIPSPPDELLSRPSFSPDGSIAIVSSDRRLLFYDVNTPELRYEAAHVSSAQARGEGLSWTLSPDGALLALLRKDRGAEDAGANVKIITVGEEREIISFDIEDAGVARCCFSPDGRFFAMVASTSKLRIVDMRARVERAGIPEAALFDFRYSADGNRIVIAAGERLHVFDATTLQPEVEFVVDQTISSFAIAAGGRSMTIGGVRGNLLFLNAVGMDSQPPVMTGVCFYNFETRKWNKEPAVRCDWCGMVVRVQEVVVEAILEIGRYANLSPADVPILSLPDEAWSDPRLVSDCIACRKPLKFNPFINDFRNRLPQPAGGPAGIIKKFWRNSRGG